MRKKDTALTDADSAVVNSPLKGHRPLSDLVANSDSAQGTVSFLLRDNLRRSWPLMTTAGVPRVLLLDTPPLNAKVR